MLRKHFPQQPLPRATLDVIESARAHARLCSALQKAALCEPTSCNGLEIPLYVNLLFVYVENI